MKNIVFSILFTITSLVVVTTSEAQSCDCLSNFNFLVNKIKKNYAGYKDKVPPSRQKEFDSLTKRLQNDAKLIGNKNCMPVLKKWVDFFGDEHLAVFLDDTQGTPTQLKNLFSSTEKIKMTESQVRQYLKQSKPASIEGIWEDDLQAYQVAIIKNKTATRDYVGFVLKSYSPIWSYGQVKFEIKKKADSLLVVFYDRDHVANTSFLTHTSSYLDIQNYGKWVKIYPKSAKKDTVQAQVAYEEPSFQLKKLDSQTNLLILPSFLPDFKPVIDSILDSNKELLRTTPNLIIDVRDNVGGSNICYEHISPLIYTSPIFTKSYSTLATDDNIEMYKKSLDSTDKHSYQMMLSQIKLMEKNKNKWVLQYPADTIKRDTVYRYPSKVAFIMNEYSASSTEFLLQEAAFSSKVTLYGKPSMGAIDYVDYLMESPLPCKIYQYHYPTTRLDALQPNTEYVIKPNVIIPDETKDWVEFVRLHIEKK